jgi:hypothetical protein
MQWYAQHVITLLLSVILTLVPGLNWLAGLVVAGQPQTIERVLPFPASGSHVLELSNINGSVHVVAEDRSDVAVTATRRVEREVGGDEGPAADFRQSGDRVLICGDSERCGCHLDSRDWRDDSDRTRVRVDFEVRVPRQITLDVCTVMGGSLRVEGTDGSYALRNVNGDVAMANVRGAGQATTVNGSINASFAAVPPGPAEFRTVNGPVDVSFPSGLSADLQMKTLNGGLYTDFESAPLPARAAVAERRDGMFRYRSDNFARVRVGRGGPTLTFQTLNGDVRVRKQP